MSLKLQSLTDKTWQIKSEDVPSDTERLREILLENRSINDVVHFLNPQVSHLMPDPLNFIDMEKAVNRVARAIQKKELITIFGDYDADGVSSTSLLVKFFKHVKVPFQYIIPNRIDDGYGVSKKNIDKYKNSLIIAVDCGCNAIKELKYAKENGIEVIVIDHHKMESVPEAVAIINPHRPDECGNYKYLCAAGLVFIFLVGLNRELKTRKFYQEGPELIDYLDIVAIATVCDVMELIDLNRAFVSTGIKIIKKRKNFGIDALMSVGHIENVDSETLAFFFGPRINAAGRLASADLGVELLTTQNPIEARKIALKLDSLNQNRKEMETEIIEDIRTKIDPKLSFICLADRSWHAGIIGIIAGRLKEAHNKPAFIISVDSEGCGKASCRSVEGVDVSAIIRKAIEAGIVSSGGGHELAAGFSIQEEKIADFVEFLKSEIPYTQFAGKELLAECFIPIKLVLSGAVETMSKLEPFGVGNPRPKFVVPNVRITACKIIGERHIQTVLSDASGNQLRTISFKSVGTKLGDILMHEAREISVCGTICVSQWRGRQQISFKIEDAAV